MCKVELRPFGCPGLLFSGLSRNVALASSRLLATPPLGPCAIARSLFDHLVRAQQNRWGYGKAERRGGLTVHDHLELGRKLHREIARLRAAQDAIDISRGTTKDLYQVGSVGDQAAVSGKARLVIDRRYVISGRRQYDRSAMCDREYIRDDDKAASRL